MHNIIITIIIILIIFVSISFVTIIFNFIYNTNYLTFLIDIQKITTTFLFSPRNCYPFYNRSKHTSAVYAKHRQVLTNSKKAFTKNFDSVTQKLLDENSCYTLLWTDIFDNRSFQKHTKCRVQFILLCQGRKYLTENCDTPVLHCLLVPEKLRKT